MASPLRVKRLDSPLSRASVVAVEPPTDQERPATLEAGNGHLTSAAAAHTPQPPTSSESPEREVLGTSVHTDLAPPPPLDEPLEFVSGRVPASLAARLNAMTLALRQRQPTRASQKGLPQQEVLAVLLWALGDPDDPGAVEYLHGLHVRFRAERYAAAAATLGG